MCYNRKMEQNSRIVKNYFSKETIELKNPIAVTVREQNLGKCPDAFRRLLDGRNTFTRNGWYLLHKEAEALEKILGYCNDCRTVFSALTSTRTHIRKGHDAKIITADSKNIVLNAIHSKSYIINEYLEEHKKVKNPPKIFKGRKKPNPVVVYNYKNNTVEEFDSCVSAADSIDSTEGTVRAVANRNKTCVSDGKFPKALKEIFVFYKRHFDLEKINKVLNKGIPCSYCEVPYANERGLLSHEGVCVDNPIVIEQSRIKNDPKESFEQFVSELGNLGKNRFVFVDVEDSKVQDKNYLSNIKNNIISEGNVPYFFLSTDWRNEKKKEIIKSMIYYRVRKNIISIGARKLIVDCTVSSSEAQEFFDKNHLNGHVSASGYFGLRDKNTKEIVQLISVRTPLHKKYRELGLIEIGRSASKIGHVVPGGFSRLIGEIESHYKKIGHLGIISYVDLMIGSGESYNDKFIKQSDTGVGYFYTDGERSYNRFRFRAKNGKSENEIARDAGVWKVYNLGNSLFVRKFS